MRRIAFVLAAASVLGGAHAAGASAAPAIARPNPAFVGIRLDYVEPIRGASGAPALLAPLEQAVIAQAVADQRYLASSSHTKLGRSLVGQPAASQMPQLAQAASGSVTSFAAVGGPAATAPPDNGGKPVAGLGTPPPVTPPSNGNFVPPPNQGFGGAPPAAPPPSTTTTSTTTTPPTTTAPGPPTRTTPTPPPTVTTAPTTTTTTTTTTTEPGAAPPQPTPPATATAPVSPPPPPPPVGASCGTAGLTITSDHATCRIQATNMAPGGSASEVMTIRNDTGRPFTLALRAEGTQNRLWQDLRLGVWEAGTAAPVPLPPLLFWTSQPNPLATLGPGDSVRYEIELLLPAATGNADQGLAASIDFVWSAQG